MSRTRRSSGRGRSGCPAGRRRTGGCRRSATAPSTRSQQPRRRLCGAWGPRSRSGPDCRSPPWLVYCALRSLYLFPAGSRPDRTREDLWTGQPVVVFFLAWTAGGWSRRSEQFSFSYSILAPCWAQKQKSSFKRKKKEAGPYLEFCGAGAEHKKGTPIF